MGYQVTLKFPKDYEIDPKYKPMKLNKTGCFRNTSETIKQEIIQYCMLDHSENPAEVFRYLRMNVGLLIEYLFDKSREYIMNSIETNGEVSWCGWNYADAESVFDNKDNLVDSCVMDLALLATVVKTPDYLEDSERFYDKVNAIRDAINIDEIAIEMMDYEFLNQYREEFDECDGKYWAEKEKEE